MKNNIPPAICAYIDHFNNPPENKYCTYNEQTDVMEISYGVLICIHIPIYKASKLCAEMHPVDFEDKIISETLSVFTHYNAR